MSKKIELKEFMAATPDASQVRVANQSKLTPGAIAKMIRVKRKIYAVPIDGEKLALFEVKRVDKNTEPAQEP